MDDRTDRGQTVQQLWTTGQQDAGKRNGSGRTERLSVEWPGGVTVLRIGEH